MQVGITFPTAQLQAAMQANSRRLANASYKALNKTAQDVQAALRQEMIRVFYRVTPYVLNSTTIIWARRDRLVAEVTFRERAAGGAERILGPQVYGGTRRRKGSEARIQLLRAGGETIYMMPARFAQYDNWGNPSRGELVIILSQLSVLDRGNNRNARTARRTRKPRTEYFAIFGRGEGYNLSGNALAPGIYRKNAAGRPLPVYFFMKGRPQYRKRLAWHEVARKVVGERIGPNFQAEMAAIL